MNLHLVAYTARGGTSGIAEVRTDRSRPTWRDCAEQIPGYVVGHDLGPAPQYTLAYDTARGRVVRSLTTSGIERVGTVVSRAADRERVWNIAVTDAGGEDVTLDFACFRA